MVLMGMGHSVTVLRGHPAAHQDCLPTPNMQPSMDQNMASAPTIKPSNSSLQSISYQTRTGQHHSHQVSFLTDWPTPSCLCPCATRAEQREKTNLECNPAAKEEATFPPKSNDSNYSISNLHRASLFPSFSPSVFSHDPYKGRKLQTPKSPY